MGLAAAARAATAREGAVLPQRSRTTSFSPRSKAAEATVAAGRAAMARVEMGSVVVARAEVMRSHVRAVLRRLLPLRPGRTLGE